MTCALVLLLAGCFGGPTPNGGAASSEPPPTTPPSPAPRPLPGTVCAQLEALTAGDPWALPGEDLPGADDTTRTRALVDAPAWADGCTVNRLGGMDVGPSCVKTLASREEAMAIHARIEEDFRACHAGWTLTDESVGAARELVAESATDLHFLRLRDNDRGGWQVAVGAMP